MENLTFFIDYHLWAHDKILQQLSGLPGEDWNRDTGGMLRILGRQPVTTDIFLFFKERETLEAGELAG